MKHICITLVLVSFLSASSYAQQKAEFWQFGLHAGAGYQSALSWGGNAKMATFTNYIVFQSTIDMLFVQAGLTFSNGKTEFGFAPRLGFALSSGTVDRVKLMPEIWAAQYLGGEDGKQFRVGVNLMMLNLKNLALQNNPALGGVKPNIPDKSSYFAFGPSLGIRLANNGFLRDWYAHAQWQFAPPSKYDEVAYAKTSWRNVWSVGLSKNFTFKKD
jgi:hypothetical protein